MTEKRFTNTDNGFIVDYKSKQKVLNLYDVVELLNELHEENKKLKQVNEMLQMDFAMTERNLIEKNEQLKARIQYLENKIQRERVSYQKQHEKWENEIQKENEQLKEEIKAKDKIIELYYEMVKE